MTDETPKSKPQAINENELEQVSGGLISEIGPPDPVKVRAANPPEPVRPGAIKAGDGSV